MLRSVSTCWHLGPLAPLNPKMAASMVVRVSWKAGHPRPPMLLIVAAGRCRESSTMPSTGGGIAEKVKGRIYQKIGNVVRQYENFIGLTDVKVAHERVLSAEGKFIDAQTARREAQLQLASLQSKLKELRLELDRAQRGDDKYLTLITQEYNLIREEKGHLEQFQILESQERDRFSALSSSLRFSHEKERAQAEATKYWSIIGSVCGAVVGIIGTGISNRLKMKELRIIVQDASNLRAPMVDEVDNKENKMLLNVTGTILEELRIQGRILEEMVNKVDSPVQAYLDPGFLPTTVEDIILDQDRRNVNLALWCTGIVVVTVPLLVKMLGGK